MGEWNRSGIEFFVGGGTGLLGRCVFVEAANHFLSCSL